MAWIKMTKRPRFNYPIDEGLNCADAVVVNTMAWIILDMYIIEIHAYGLSLLGTGSQIYTSTRLEVF